MPWVPPAPPLNHKQSRISYWQRILAIPATEPSAPLLRDMAAHRLMELGALSVAEARQARAALEAWRPVSPGLRGVQLHD
jgi:hypothetical protein